MRTILWGVLLLGATVLSTVGQEERKPFRMVDIPKEEHGYGDNLNSMVIRSKVELDVLLEQVSKQEHWNRKKEFVEALKKAQIDFDKEALVLLRHTEGSGSIQVTFETPVLQKGNLLCTLKRDVPEVGTADMAYYGFALAVNKSVKAVVWKIDETVTTLPLSE